MLEWACRGLQIGDWNNFDVFKVAKLTRNRPLETVVCAGLQHLDVVKPLDLPMQRVHSYLRVRAPFLCVV